jgi:hypothetical protein
MINNGQGIWIILGRMKTTQINTHISNGIIVLMTLLNDLCKEDKEVEVNGGDNKSNLSDLMEYTERN